MGWTPSSVHHPIKVPPANEAVADRASTFEDVSAAGETAQAGLFGGNILAPRSQMTGTGSYSELVEELGVEGLRYPGGSLTEEYFDISNPNSTTATGNETGETIDFIPLSDFMEAAADLGAPVTIVVPTRNQLSEEVDAYGNRLPEIDEEALRDFVYDTVTGVYGDARVEAFEIGNEYWGSGRMNAAEYGRLASEMTKFIDDELKIIEETTDHGENVDIVVQMGTNFGFSSLDDQYVGKGANFIINDLNEKFGLNLGDDVIRGTGDPNWGQISNHIIMSFFDDDSIEAVDGIAAHVYSKEPALPGQRSYHLDTIEETWGDEFEDQNLDIYVTEWNSSGATALFERDEDYGLFQAHEMLNMIEEFMYSGVDVAHAWPILQNTANAFSHGFDHSQLTPAGNMFAMMSSALPGKTMLDFNPGSRETEADLDNVDVHAFYGDGELVFFFASTSNDVSSTDVDISNLVEGYGTMAIEVLGVEPGDAPGSNSSTSVVQSLDESAVHDDGFLTVLLAPGEIMKVTITNIKPTDMFEAVTTYIDSDGEIIDDLSSEEIFGSSENDLLKGSDGDDTIFGLGGDDTLNGGRAMDKLLGGNGNDVLRGREGNDFLSGQNGDDYLNGDSGHDYLKGSDGRDTLIGGWGDDTLNGGQKNDWLDAGPGNNEVQTGFGKDVVSIIDKGPAFNTRITDFTLGRDTLNIDAEGVLDRDDVEIHISSDELIMMLHGDSEKTIVLEGEFDEEDIWDSGSIQFTAAG